MPYMCPTRKITKTIDIELLNHLLPYMPYSIELQDLQLCNQSNIHIKPPMRTGVRHSRLDTGAACRHQAPQP